MGIFWGGTELLTFAQTAILVTLCTWFVIKGNLTIGTMVAFTSYTGMMLWPLRQLGRILVDMSKASVSIVRISEILDIDSELSDGIIGTKPLTGDIVFDHVSFLYKNGKQALSDISFTAKKGQTIAILGATGSGKSTMMYLLQRLYEYDSGKITIDGVEIRKYNRKWLRQNIGIVLQEPFLYSRSIKDNIAITRPTASEREVQEVTHIAALTSVLQEFEKGFDTEVGEKGVTLSGGQKQRVAIARMLMQNTPVLIFDDSLSAVDTETDQMIRQRLKKRKGESITFIISHRITTLSEADLILVMEDGKIIQSGIHKELTNIPGLYRRVWEIQNMSDEIDVH
jgi:ATP-binding cassette subfamily B protein